MSKIIHRQLPIKEEDWSRADEISKASLYNISRAKILTIAINKGLEIVDKDIEK